MNFLSCIKIDDFVTSLPPRTINKTGFYTLVCTCEDDVMK